MQHSDDLFKSNIFCVKSVSRTRILKAVKTATPLKARGETLMPLTPCVLERSIWNPKSRIIFEKKNVLADRVGFDNKIGISYSGACNLALRYANP